jgi:hypothetical protein
MKRSSKCMEREVAMGDGLRIHFWFESGLACLTTGLAVVTVVHRTWIESAFGIDPDQGSGAAEWLIVLVAVAVAVTAASLARREWRHRRISTV